MSHSTVSILVSKLSSAVLIALVAIGGYLIPKYLSKKTERSYQSNSYEKCICLLNCFGAGTIMGMTFFHLIPETIHICMDSGLYIKLNKSIFNLCYPLILCGASLVLLAEHVIATRDCHPCPDIPKVNIIEKDGNSTPLTMEPNNFVDTKCASVTCPGHVIDVYDALEKQNIVEPAPMRVNLLERIKNMCKCRGFFLAIALSFHSIFEGIALGSTNSHSHVWLLLIGISSHKWAASMALSVSLYSGNNKKSTIAILVTIFTLATPIGILIGMGLSGIGNMHAGIINALASGTLIYIGAEIISHEFSATGFGKRFPLYQWFSALGGAALMLALVVIELMYIPHHH